MQAGADGGNFGRARRPQYLFSGLARCGVCGSGFIMASANRLSCFGARHKGICDNGLTIRRDEAESRVLKALQERLLNQELFEEFCEEFAREMNRLRMQRTNMTSARREVARIGARIKKLLSLMLDDEIAVDERKGVDAGEHRGMLAAAGRRASDGKSFNVVCRHQESSTSNEVLMSEQRWLKVPDAARYAGVSRDTIYTACEQGELRHAKVGGRRAIRLRMEWIDAWLERHARGTSEPATIGG